MPIHHEKSSVTFNDCDYAARTYSLQRVLKRDLKGSFLFLLIVILDNFLSQLFFSAAKMKTSHSISVLTLAN